ncbi:MAG: hypothetical protein WC551_00320 [Patescibacteria group bacterium]
MKCKTCEGRGYLEGRFTVTDNFGDDDGEGPRCYRYLCPDCRGRGSYDGPQKFEVKQCASCGGTGSHEYEQLDGPTRFWTCRECDGMGLVSVCILCRGCCGYTDPAYGFWVDYCGQCSGGKRVLVPRG